MEFIGMIVVTEKETICFLKGSGLGKWEHALAAAEGGGARASCGL